VASAARSPPAAAEPWLVGVRENSAEPQPAEPRAPEPQLNEAEPAEISAHADLLDILQVEMDPVLLTLALTHRSYAYENGGLPTNERLEFLGDSVLGVVVTDHIYRRFPLLPEGKLAKIRAAVVNMRALAIVAGTLGVGDHVYLGRGEETTGGRAKASILADTMEALIGATYLSGGIDRAADLVHRLIDPLVAEAITVGAGLDWKTSLQELTSRQELGVPEYRITDAGPDHAKIFVARAVVAGEVVGEGSGASKKEAEQLAARTAWTSIDARSREGGRVETVVPHTGS